MNSIFTSALLAATIAAPVGPAQEPRLRMVVGTGVVCRTEPNREAAIRNVYRIGDIVVASREERTNGETWYFDQTRVSGRYPTCWIHGQLTTEYDYSRPDVAVSAAAARALERVDASFEDLVAVDNLLTAGVAGRTGLLGASGILQFRRLEILRRIAAHPDARGRAVRKEPLKHAWFIAHQDQVKYFEPGDNFFIPVELYWALHDRYPEEPWSEELAWTAAQLGIPSDECYSDCVFGKIQRTFGQYWRRYPNGKFVADALERAIPPAEYAVELAMYDSPQAALFQNLRDGLAEVSAPSKSRFLDLLERAEKQSPTP